MTLVVLLDVRVLVVVVVDEDVELVVVEMEVLIVLAEVDVPEEELMANTSMAPVLSATRA